jgi:hypothetical protein
MSEETVELVRRANRAWNEFGPESIKHYWALDGEWHDPLNLSRFAGCAGQGCDRCLFDGAGHGCRWDEDDHHRTESARRDSGDAGRADPAWTRKRAGFSASGSSLRGRTPSRPPGLGRFESEVRRG